MPRNGSGTMNLVAGNPVVSGTTISSTVHNNTNTDIATALTNSLAKDGQTTPTANLPMGSFRHTGVGDASARNQYAVVNQVQDGDYNLVGSVSGTNTIVGSMSPSISAYAAGMQVLLIPANANTGATTLNLNAVGALDVQKHTSAGQVALAANDLRAGIPALLILDSGGDDWILLNPYSGALGDVTIGNLTVTNINGVAAPAAANPTATIGLTAANGSATTYMRSDGAPALSQAITPTWSGQHIWGSTSGSGASSAVYIATPVPSIGWRETGASANNGIWTQTVSSEQFQFLAVNDANNSAQAIFTVDRTGTTVDSIALTSTALTWNGSAMVNVASAPTWTQTHTFTHTAITALDGAALFSAAVPLIGMRETGAGTNEKVWDIVAVSGQLQFQVATDAGSGGANWLTVDRTGTTVDRVAFPSTGTLRFSVGSDDGVTDFGGGNPWLAAIRGVGSALRVATSSSGVATDAVVHIQHQVTSGNNMFIDFLTDTTNTARGSIDYNRGGGAVRYNTTSDARLKTNFAPAGSAIDLAMRIPVESFDWIETGHHVEFGYVAQRLNESFPDAVSRGDVWQIDRSSLIPVLHRALQEINEDLQRHKRRVAKALEALLAD